MIVFMKCLGIGKFIVTESRLVVSRSWGKKERGVTAYWVSVWNGELVLNLDSGDSCTHCESTHWVPLNYTL